MKCLATALGTLLRGPRRHTVCERSRSPRVGRRPLGVWRLQDLA